MRRWGILVLCAGVGLFAAGCPKGQNAYNQGRKAEEIKDLDAALEYYQKALQADPNNANYKIKTDQLRFDASTKHINEGVKLRNQGDLQGAVAEFQRATVIDPSSPAAEQELRNTLALIAEKNKAAGANGPPSEGGESQLAELPPEIKPMSRAPINLTMSNDAKIVFDTIGKLAGLTIIYDPDFPARRISVELSNVTLQQALDIVSMESKAFWRAETQNIIFVIPDNPQKRRDYDEQVIRTFYLANTVQAQDLTEIVTGLRSLLDLKRIQQVNSQNAIIIRDTPDKLAAAEKMIHDIDLAKPEVVVQVEVLQARTDRLRDLGVLPGQSASAVFTPGGTAPSSGGSGSNSTASNLTLRQLKHLSTNDYSVTLPGATANAILTDTYTKIIQNPEIRSVDGQSAKLKIGDRIPVATGSFQAGVGVGGTSAAGIVNPLVNTQFQYQDVGVNVDMTPRVHPDREISLKLKVEVSSVTGQQTIGGIQQPIISQRTIEHDIRLKEGQASILGGLFERTDTQTLNGWPGFAKIPFLKYLFSDTKTDHQENEVLIVLIPHIVRMPGWTQENLRPLYTGSEANLEVRKEADLQAPVEKPSQPPSGPGTPPAAVAAPPNAASQPEEATPQGTQPARLRFEPQAVTLKVGQQTTLGIAVDNVNDLFSIPLLLQFDPKTISIDSIQHGGFLSGGTQEIAIVDRVDAEHGQAIISATRQPNTPGVSGSGTILGIVVKALAPGSTNMSIVQVNAKDSQQKAIPLVTGEATIQVQP